ncbi:MAG: response regulator [Candidatus Altiarchaeales archaeon]|nr:response regulator [Candidatus Altiarchaeales archaeon]
MTKRILHVEDDEDTQLLVKTLLEKQGHIISNAVNGSECLDILEKYDIDLVLLDVMLPDTSGWDILGRIRKNPKNNDLKTVFLSVIPVSDEQLETLKDDGVADYITKPFRNRDLVERIRKALG